jgi:3-demethoxyubiquinol 3-hydroxylase
MNHRFLHQEQAVVFMQQFRVISPIEAALGSFCGFLTTVATPVVKLTPSTSPSVAADEVAALLSDDEKKVSQGLMRVNHVGEVCAQALYESQSLFARSESQRQWMKEAGAEEKQHLDWTKARIDALGGRVSYLNPVWYLSAFVMGAAVAALGDQTSLSFVLETERQVEAHLEGHLDRLPAADSASREVVAKMREDEVRHAEVAATMGAIEFSAPLKLSMKVAAKVMTTTAYYI